MPEQVRGLRIQSMSAENVLRLKVVNIEPDEHAVVIGGKNGAGKSSVLNAIAMAIGGGKQVPGEPLHRGEKRGSIVLDCGDFKLTRGFRRNDNGTLKIEAAPGKAAPNAQKLIDRLYEALCFDPFQWARLCETKTGIKEQRDDLARVSKLPIDLGANQAARSTAFANRTEINRDVASLKGALDVRLVPANAPDEPVDVSELAAKYRVAVEHNDALRGAERALATALRGLDNYDAAVERERSNLKQAVDDANAALAGHNAAAPAGRAALDDNVSAADEALSALGDVRDTEAITAQMDNAKELNEAHKAKEDRAELEQSYREKKHEADVLTEVIGRLDDERSDALKNATLPVDGLGFDEDGVTYKGMPFAQLAQSERLRISCAMAMAMNETENGGAGFKVILVRDGALLDDEHLELLLSMAKERDHQLWIEVVGDSDHPAAIIMEDGAVREPEPAT